MAKKQKRQVSNVSKAVTKTPVSTAAASNPVRVSKMPAASEEFNPDYSYVIADLKRIGILAVSFTVVLVVLSFIL